MRRIMTVAAAMTMMACSGGLLAADKPATVAAGTDSKEKQMEKLGALRGRLMLKLSELPKAMDPAQNGANAAYQNIQQIEGKNSANIARALQDENAKAQEFRSQETIDNLNRKRQKDSEMYTEFGQKDWPRYNRAIDEQSRAYGAINQIFANVGNLELCWINAGFDLDALINLLTMIETKADDIKTQCTTIAGDFTKIVGTWEAFARE